MGFVALFSLPWAHTRSVSERGAQPQGRLCGALGAAGEIARVWSCWALRASCFPSCEEEELQLRMGLPALGPSGLALESNVASQ